MTANIYSPNGGNATSLPFYFTKVIENIPLERRSAKSVSPIVDENEIKYDYSQKANIPPGVFALHHHRLDYTLCQNLETNVRHRLGLSDHPCFEQNKNKYHNISDCCNNLSTPWECCQGNNCYSSNCDEVIKFKEGDIEHTRCFIQFHVAYNNLNEYRLDTNEGCIVLNETNFSALFPFSFLELPTSPLIRHNSYGIQPEQKGRVLVFITDLTYNKKSSLCEKQNNQIDFFNTLLNIQLNDKHFNDTPERQELKNNWLLALPLPLPSAPNLFAPQSFSTD